MMIDLLLASQLCGRSFMMPPGVPADRVKAAREALYKMTADRDFLEETGKLKLDIDLVRGEEMQEILKGLYATPREVIEATLKAVEQR